MRCARTARSAAQSDGDGDEDGASRAPPLAHDSRLFPRLCATAKLRAAPRPRSPCLPCLVPRRERRQLARRLKPDTTLLKAQLLKQMGAVQDAKPGRRHELLQQRAQQREHERAEVAARLAALLPQPPQPQPPKVPRGGDGARTPRANAAHLARYRHEPEAWHGDAEGETHRQRARSLAGDISRMLR